MTTTLAQAHPVPAHTTRRAVKAMAALAIFAGAAGGLYEGAQAFTRHYQQPTSTVSYADQETVTRTLHGAWHTPATAGDFRPAADISHGNVVSVVEAVQP